MKIEYVDINLIKPYPNNPRDNSVTVQKLATLLANKEVPFNVPIVVDKHNIIVKGHTRWKALKSLGETEIPVIYSTNSDEINNEDRIQDNVVQELSKWKHEALSLEIRDTQINAKEFDIDFRTLGYDEVPLPSHVSEADVTKAQEVFTDQSRFDKEFVEIKCPHCNEVFMLDRNEVKKYV